MKTGALICAAVEAGAILGRVPPEARTGLRGYAHDLGLAFQIADDLLDAEGDEAVVGKALRKDGEAGKETFLSLLGAERAREQCRMLVDQAIAHLHSFGGEADLLRRSLATSSSATGERRPTKSHRHRRLPRHLRPASRSGTWTSSAAARSWSTDW